MTGEKKGTATKTAGTPAEQGKALSQDTAKELRTLRDRVSQRIHSLEDRGRDVWDALDPELHKLVETVEDHAEEISDEARLQVHLGWMDARERLGAIEPWLTPLVNQARQVRDATKEAVADFPGEAVKLQAHLAKMDLEQQARRQRKEIPARLREAGRTARELGHEALEEIREIVRVLSGTI